MEKVILLQDDLDRHEAGCQCGDCDTNGKSYGVGVYSADIMDDDGEVDPDQDVLNRVYGPSEQEARERAEEACRRDGYQVVK